MSNIFKISLVFGVFAASCGGPTPAPSTTAAPFEPADSPQGAAVDSAQTPNDTSPSNEPVTPESEKEAAFIESIEWVEIQGGTFEMGNPNGKEQEKPVHTVTVPSFEITRTEITVAQYQQCVIEETCAWPPDRKDSEYCNYGNPKRSDHPFNCVDWHRAKFYCEWIGARLPTEAEWEYAARSQGQKGIYPWGDTPASCDMAVMASKDAPGCGKDHTAPVCSKPSGNTEQGLCDMAGNVWEWTEDQYHKSYLGAPTDGSAWLAQEDTPRVVKGGAWNYEDAAALAATNRFKYLAKFGDIVNGFRCVR